MTDKMKKIDTVKHLHLTRTCMYDIDNDVISIL